MTADLPRGERLEHELHHAEVLLASPEEIWGWGTPAGMARARRRGRLIVEAGSMGPGTRTLEVGCGTGLFTQLVSQCGASIEACELSEKLLERARGRTYGGPVTFVAGDATDLSGRQRESYDVVWGSSVLHHLDLDPFLAAALALLKPGGRLVFAEPNMLNPQVLAERKIGWLRKARGVSPDETAFVRFGLKRVLERHGFAEVSILPHEFLHPAIPERLLSAGQLVTSLLEKVPLLREMAGSLLICARKPE